MPKHVNLVDLVKSFPTNIFLQNLASIQRRTRPIAFAYLAEKSENGSISNLSTRGSAAAAAEGAAGGPAAETGGAGAPAARRSAPALPHRIAEARANEKSNHRSTTITKWNVS